MDPNELPGWANQFQAIDLKGATVADLGRQVEAIATRIKQKKSDGLLIFGTLVLGILVFGGKE